MVRSDCDVVDIIPIVYTALLQKVSEAALLLRTETMKYAAAMRYGGELVAAADADYQDFTYLMPLCPECKEPVHLRAAGTRIVNEKKIKISSHWSHFKTKDIELAKVCEQRVGGYTVEEIERRSAIARGQRLSRLEKQFLSMIKTSPMLSSAVDCYEGLKKLGFWGNSVKVFRQYFLFNLKDLKSYVSHVNRMSEKGLVCFKESGSMSRVKENYRRIDLIDKKMHLLIIEEVLDFLASKAGKQSLSILQGFAMIEVIDNTKVTRLDFSNTNHLAEMCSTIVVGLYTVLWTEEFAKLEKQSDTHITNEPSRDQKLRRTRSTSSGKGFAMPKP